MLASCSPDMGNKVFPALLVLTPVPVQSALDYFYPPKPPVHCRSFLNFLKKGKGHTAVATWPCLSQNEIASLNSSAVSPSTDCTSLTAYPAAAIASLNLAFCS